MERMPVSEDEFERPAAQVGSAPNPGTMTKAEQRKSNKPIMEKRRRARINHCLNELKTLILDAMKKDPARHSKLEKADILEMTVKHLQQIQRQQLATAVAADPGVIMRFKSGFDECAAEVSRYISRLEGVDAGVKQRLTAHLHRCVASLQQISTYPQQNMFGGLDKGIVIPTATPTPASAPGDVNNNSNQTGNGDRIQIPGGLHLIPSRLPTGELALLLPNHMSAFLSGSPAPAAFSFPPVLSPTGLQLQQTTHASAFTAVNKSQDYPSPSSTSDVKREPGTKEDPQNYKVADEARGHGKLRLRSSGCSFQRNAADSTTVLQEDGRASESGFKPFHVEIPNTRLRAHISLPRTEEDDREPPGASSSSSLKREAPSPGPEAPVKMPRISLDVTLEDGAQVPGNGYRVPGGESESSARLCKRISVIVTEDSSKMAGRDTSREVTASESTQKDMWRPW